MVMFHHKIPYSTALHRGATQSGILGELTRNATTLNEVDFAEATKLIESRLPPLS
jgi:hypothetical protein